MRSKKHKNNSKDDREKSRKKHKRKGREEKHTETDSSFNTSEDEQEWVEKSVSPSTTFANENAAATSRDQRDASKREDWMNMKSIFPCVFKERGKDSHDSTNSANKTDPNELGQSCRELNPYWKNGGCGLPVARSTERERIVDAEWLKKSLRRAVEQAAIENRSLEEIAAERWGSLEEIQSMISEAEGRAFRSSAGYSKSTFETVKRTSHFAKSNSEKPRACQSSRSAPTDNSSRTDQRQRYDSPLVTSRQKRNYKKPMDDDYCHSTVYKSNHIRKKNWQKSNEDEKVEGKQSDLNPTAGESGYSDNADGTCSVKTKEIEPLTEAEMNKLGAKIVKAEIMGNTALAEELKLQLRKVRDLANDPQQCKTANVQCEILTRTDEKGVCRPLERRGRSGESSGTLKRKNTETHVSGNRVKRYFDDDKYCLEQLFQKERGRSTREDDAEFAKVASKNMDMDMEEIFEERIARVKSDVQQDTMDRSRAIQEHKRFSKSLDTCQWCIDSKRMMKHTIVAMDSEICLSLPRCASLTVGHCVLTPTQHVACQLQLDENVWEKLKLFKRALRTMFAERNQYPVFYEVYKSRHKFPHMRLECVPLPRKVGELAPMYFKKALLECETEWSMNKKIIDLEGKNVRQAVPNGLSYFAVEFEGNRGYAHIIEDEHLFPKNFAEEIIGGMLDLDHDVWRKPREQSFEQLHEKILKFSETWKKYESETKN